MFFPERVVNIQPQERVLEIGPGSQPHERSDVLLEMAFECEEEASVQRSHGPELKTTKEVVFYDGTRFPFEDGAFDYVICAQVLEHVDNVELFLSEINRVAGKGYMEFPTPYYDYLYNIETHLNFLLNDQGTIRYMTKKEVNLDQFREIQFFFNKTLELRYSGVLKDLKPYFFQGYEWDGALRWEKAESLSEVTYAKEIVNNIPRKPKKKKWFKRIFS